MNKLAKAGIAAVASAATLAGGVALATSANAKPDQTAMARPVSVGWQTTRQDFVFPRAATTFEAGQAGSVTIVPVGPGAIRVAGVHAAAGYKPYVDIRRGSTVDVYLNYRERHVRFEAVVGQGGKLTVTVMSGGHLGG